MEVLALSGTPRPKGNSRILLDLFLEEAPAQFRIHLFDAYSMVVFPCRACERCRDGLCVIEDDMQKLYPIAERADFIVVSHPVYFYGPPAPVKAVYDRCQPFWYKRPKGSKCCALITTSATYSERGFEVSASIFKAWAKTLGGVDFIHLKFGGLESEQEVLSRQELLEEVRRHGRSFFGSKS